MGERNDRVIEGYIGLGRSVVGMMQAVEEGRVVVAGADMDNGQSLFVTKHPGILKLVASLGAQQKVDEDKLPLVEGDFMLHTIADFDIACRVRIAEEQDNPNSDTCLIAILCDAIRLGREMVNIAKGRLTQ